MAEKTLRRRRGTRDAAARPLSRVKLLISILTAGDDKRIAEILREHTTALSFTFPGTGTARSSVLDYLGIGSTDKAVVCSLIPERDEMRILHEIRTKMSLYLVGKGISFTLPLSAVSRIVAGGVAGAAEKMTEEEDMTEETRKYDLIVAAVAAGNVDEAMEAARSAGAAGGTILRARSLGNEKIEQLAGITLQNEQELLLILTRRESRLSIMQALSDRVGLKTAAGGVLFSLPVDHVAGVGAAGGETDTQEE